MDKTTYAKNAYINVQRGTGITAFTPYLALSLSAPSDDGSGVTEPTLGGYARLPITWTAPVDGVTANAEIVFSAVGGAFGTITHVLVYDAVSGGNAWFYTALDAPETVADGDTLTFFAGDLDWTEA